MSEPTLFHRELGNGSPLIILHGVFGSSDNWMTIARSLAENYKVFTVDLRNHGQSFHSDQFDYPSMVNDLKVFLEKNQIDKPTLVGHSMGGKVAMNFAIKHPNLLNKLVVVDISPRSYPIHHDRILEGLSSLELSSLQSRNEADEKLSKFVEEPTVRNFLLKNLGRDEGGQFQWKLNLPIIRMNIERVGVGLIAEGKYEGETLFIKGSLSHYIDENDSELISRHFPNSSIVTIEGSGHWVHAEKPEEFLKVLNEFLSS